VPLMAQVADTPEVKAFLAFIVKLGSQAYVYVRQSTPDQLLHNHESRRRQYALASMACHTTVVPHG
jgi:hypothetical protein